MNHSEKTELEKNVAAEKALDFIESGMIVGLGSGTTFRIFLHKLAKRINEGLKIKTVATSDETASLANSLGIKVTDFSKIDTIDVTIDGADEVDAELNGSASLKNVWMINSEKFVKRLGKFSLPVEVVPFGAEHTFKKLKEMDLHPNFRMNSDKKYITDGKHFIIDVDISKKENMDELDKQLKSIAGVIETGLFLNLCSVAIIGRGDKSDVVERA